MQMRYIEFIEWFLTKRLKSSGDVANLRFYNQHVAFQAPARRGCFVHSRGGIGDGNENPLESAPASDRPPWLRLRRIGLRELRSPNDEYVAIQGLQDGCGSAANEHAAPLMR
jgi:hypothetical protein